MFKGRVWLLSFECAPVWRALPCSHGAPTKTSSTLNKKWAKPGVFHYSSHTGTPDSAALRGERYEISIGIILGWVLMSISSAIFNGPAASPLTPTRHFKGALLSIPQSCIKHVNLGDMLTTRPHVLPNSNEDSDHLGRERSALSRGLGSPICPSSLLTHRSNSSSCCVKENFGRLRE